MMSQNPDSVCFRRNEDDRGGHQWQNPYTAHQHEVCETLIRKRRL